MIKYDKIKYKIVIKNYNLIFDYCIGIIKISLNCKYENYVFL